MEIWLLTVAWAWFRRVGHVLRGSVCGLVLGVALGESHSWLRGLRCAVTKRGRRGFLGVREDGVA